MSNPEETPVTNFQEIDKLIHEPARLSLMSFLYVIDEADFLFLMRQTRLTKGNLSSHLAKLENGGYVEIEKKFVNKMPRTLIRLSEKGRSAFRNYRDSMKNMLENLPE